MPANTFDSWCREGHVKALNDVSGKGNHRVFKLMQIVGIAVADELRHADQGCASPYVSQVVTAFGDMTEGQLLKKLAEGATHLVMVYNGNVILDGRKV